MPRIDQGRKVRMDISIDSDLQDRLIKVCQQEERSMSNLISRALKEYLPKFEKGD